MYMYVYVYMYVCVYVCIYIYIRTRVGVHMHYYRCFLTLACVCVWGLDVGFVSACSLLALVAGVGGYVLAGLETGVLSCIFLSFCGC